MVSVRTMAPVHEKMHKKTAEKKGKWYIRSKMLAVVNHQVKSDYDKKSRKHQTNGSSFHNMYSLRKVENIQTPESTCVI